MQLFYYDKVIIEQEKQLDFSPIIKHLEERFKEKSDMQTLATIIACSWYYLIEGDINQKPVNYDWELLQSKWKEYLDLGLKDYCDNEKICFAAGYTLILYWMHLGIEYENKGLQLVKKCYEISEDENLKELAKNVIENFHESKSKKYKKLENAEKICNDLFPSNSLIDSYFKETRLR